MNLRSLAIWVVVGVVLVALYGMMNQTAKSGAAQGEVTYSQLLNRVDSGHVKKAVVRDGAIEVTDAEGKTVTANTPQRQDDLIQRLEKGGADIQQGRSRRVMLTVLSVLAQLLPVLLLFGVWFLFMRQMQERGAFGAMKLSTPSTQVEASC